MTAAVATARATVLLAEDHPGSRELLCQLLDTAFEVIGVVDDGCSLVSEAERLRPDVIVTDVAMPGLDGIDAARQVLALRPDARIVLVTGYGDAAVMERGLETGALGFVAKLLAGDALIPAVEAALRGERAIYRVQQSAP